MRIMTQHKSRRSQHNLSLDHTPKAWELVEQGKRLTLKDVASGLLVVRCMKCQHHLGAARGDNVTRTD